MNQSDQGLSLDDVATEYDAGMPSLDRQNLWLDYRNYIEEVDAFGWILISDERKLAAYTRSERFCVGMYTLMVHLAIGTCIRSLNTCQNPGSAAGTGMVDSLIWSGVFSCISFIYEFVFLIPLFRYVLMRESNDSGFFGRLGITGLHCMRERTNDQCTRAAGVVYTDTINANTLRCHTHANCAHTHPSCLSTLAGKFCHFFIYIPMGFLVFTTYGFMTAEQGPPPQCKYSLFTGSFRFDGLATGLSSPVAHPCTALRACRRCVRAR